MPIEIKLGDKVIVTINPDEFQEGVFQKGNVLIMISQGFPGLKLSVSTPIQPDLNSRRFKNGDNDESFFQIERMIKNYDTYPYVNEQKIFVIFTSDFNYLNEAVSWLMHVLTGPDPRTHDSPLPNRKLIDQLKESTEPRKIYKEYKLVFFAGSKKETVEAFDLYYKTLLHLHNFGRANFAENYAIFIYGDGKSELAKTSPMTAAEFKKALERLKQYEQHEFTGNMLNFSPF